MRDKSEYTLKDVKEVYRFLSFRSLQTWTSRGVIIPAAAARGKGSTVVFSYLNLLEIGVVIQLVRFGFSRYSLLKRIMNEAHAGRIPWIGDERLGFDCFFTMAEENPFAPATAEWADRKGFGVVRCDEIKAWLNTHSEFSTGIIIVDVRAVKSYVDKMLKNYVRH